MYAELIERKKSNRGKIVSASAIDVKQDRPYEAYSSMMYFDETIKTHIEFTKTQLDDFDKPLNPNGTVSGFEGDYTCRFIWLDVDAENDLKTALESAQRIFNKLVTNYGISKWDIPVYFSGHKGFHLGIHVDFIGGVQSSNRLPYQVGKFVKHISEGIEHVDLSIYNPNRFLRLPNSKHEKSGLYKVPLSLSEFLNFGLENILELAKTARPDFKFDFGRVRLSAPKLVKAWELSNTAPEQSQQAQKILKDFPEGSNEKFEKAKQIVQSKTTYENSSKNKYVFRLACWCNDFGIDREEAEGLIIQHISEDFDVITTDFRNKIDTIKGVYRRNDQAFDTKEAYIKKHLKENGTAATKLLLTDKAIRFNRVTKLTQREILEVIQAFNATQKAPIKQDELYEIVANSINAKPERSEDDYGFLMRDLVPDFLERATRKSSGLTLGIPAIDEIENHDYESRVVAIIGMAGTKKSITLKDILCANVDVGKRGVYSSMEDTALRQFQRILNRSFESTKINHDGTQMNPEKQLARIAKKSNNLETLQEALVSELDRMYGDRLIIDEETNHTKESYVPYIELLIRKFGGVDVFGIDGLSMMGGTGKEWERAVENSKDAKDLAKKYKLMIPLLIHVPKDANPTTRDLWNYTRGGSKVADNADIFIALSRCLDLENSTTDNPKYHEDLIYLSYWGKRTNGRYLDLILKLNPVTLQLEQTDIDPKEFD